MITMQNDHLGLLRAVDGWSSHRPALFAAIDWWMAYSGAPVSILECGSGFGSTPMLHDYVVANGGYLLTMEHDQAWFDKFCFLGSPRHGLHRPLVEIAKLAHDGVDAFVFAWRNAVEGALLNQKRIGPGVAFGVALVDHAPAEARAPVIDALRGSVPLVVVHDTEPASEHGYRMAEAMSRYKHRRDFMHANTGTTLLSDTIDVAQIPVPEVPYGKV